MSLVTRVVALLVAFVAVVGGAAFVVFHYIGGAGGTMPTINYASVASGGQVNVFLQEDPQNNSASTPDWVSYYVQDPHGTKAWVHTTLFSVPANTTVHMTIYGYDGCTPLRNNYFSQVQGTTTGDVTVQQFMGTKPLGAKQTTSVINGWSNCNVAHTFAIPSLHLFVPVASPNAENSANHLCGASPCEPASGAHAVETFSFRTPDQSGVFRWQCLVPCGGGYIDGNGGPMQTFGYMTGMMTVVR